MKKSLRSVIKAIMSEIEEHFKKRKVKVEFYSNTKKISHAPLILLDIENINCGESIGTEQTPLECHFMAFCLLDSNMKHGQFAIREFASKLIALINENNWNLGEQSEFPINIESEIAVFHPHADAMLCWQIEWTQTIYLGDNIWDSEGITPTEINLSQVPEVGTAHKEDYINVAKNS